MALSDVIFDDAKAIIDFDGDVVVIHPKVGDTYEVRAVVRAGELETQGTDQGRMLGYDLLIAVSKSDVPIVERNAMHVTIPGVWVEKTGPQKMRISYIVGDRSDPGVWLLGLS